MKTLAKVLAYTLVTVVASQAHASTTKLPREFAGTWCQIDTHEDITAWSRKCDGGEKLVVTNGSIELEGRTCRWTSGSVNRLGKFLASVKCDGKNRYTANLWMLVSDEEDGDILDMQERKCQGNECWK
jgi:hypothetical protein